MLRSRSSYDRHGGILDEEAHRAERDVTPESPPRSPAPGFVRPTFEQLYASARLWLPNELRRRGVRGDVEDLLHDVVMIAHRRLERFDPSKAHRGKHDDPVHALRAWMVGIAWHRVAKHHEAVRRSALLGIASVTDMTYEQPTAEHAAAAGERRRILLDILATIKPARAEVIVLHVLFEMSTPDIARQLALNENTVKSRLSRGRHDVRRAIDRLPREHRSALHDIEAG
jgi:RNA polymerase sigma factor (sigma-70 family)